MSFIFFYYFPAVDILIFSFTYFRFSHGPTPIHCFCFFLLLLSFLLSFVFCCRWATITVASLNSTNPFFGAMNLCVHSVMYTWYAATRTGWKSPKWMMMGVTLIQLFQMVAGCYIVLVAQSDNESCVWTKNDPIGSKAATWMYFSYLVLFGKLFLDNYCTTRKKKKN